MESNGFSLQKALDEYLIEEISRDTTKSFYVSDMGRCMRMRILKRSGRPAISIDARTKRIFAIGNINHTFLQDILAKGNYLLEKEITVEWPEYELRGRADAIVQTPENGLLLYEFKNTHSRKIIYGEIDRHYILQGLTYLSLLNKGYNNAIKQLRVCLISRDDLIIKEVGFFLTDDWRQTIIDELEKLKTRWQVRDTELPPEIEKGSKEAWSCGYCSYWQYCPKVMEWLKKPAGIVTENTKSEITK